MNTEKFLFRAFRWWEIRSFFQQKDGKMIFTWPFWAFHVIPGLGKYGFSCSELLYQYPMQLKSFLFFLFCFVLGISITSDINLLLSPLFLLLSCNVCCVEIKSGRNSFNFSERFFHIIFRSTFNKKWLSNYLWICYLYLYFLCQLFDILSLMCI